MSTSVLVINCGSSSIKYALVSERREDRIFGLAENLGSADARIKGITAGGQPLELSIPHADHEKALETILERLSSHAGRSPSPLASWVVVPRSHLHRLKTL